MLHELLRIDSEWFLAINHFRNGFLDFVMPWFSNRWIWIPLYVFMAFAIYKYYGRKVGVIGLSIALMIVLSDQGANLVKNNVQRPRPCHNTELLYANAVNAPEGCGGPYGYFSGHAANCFAIS